MERKRGKTILDLGTENEGHGPIFKKKKNDNKETKIKKRKTFGDEPLATFYRRLARNERLS